MNNLHKDITFKGVKDGYAEYENNNFYNIGKPQTSKVYESEKIDFSNYLKEKHN
jgi:hypothetical protein